MGKRLTTLKLTATLLFASVGLLLAAVSLPFTGWRALSVQTGSMKPAINPGALVLVHRVSPASLKKGDVITYKSKLDPGTTVTHRIIERQGLATGPQQTIVRGDANKVADAPVYDQQIVGKVVGSVPYLGHALNILKKPLGLALCIYLPIVLIFISEIRLLVRRLTQLEMSEHAALQPATVAAGPPQETDTPPTPPQPAPGNQPARNRPLSAATPTPLQAGRKKPHSRKLIGGMSVLLLVVSATIGISPTFATLSTEASLTGNTITTAAVTPPEPSEARMLINEVAFGQTLRGRYNNRGPVTWYTEPATITLYGSQQWQQLDLRGWTLESHIGVVYRFQGARWHVLSDRTQVFKLGRYTSPRTAGDYLVLKNRRGVVVDALSWGTYTTYLNPAAPAVKGGDLLQRVQHIDTDHASDWQKLPL